MAENEHVLDGFGETDEHHGDRRTVSFRDGVLTVDLYNTDDGYRTTNFLLTEVVRRWAPVDTAKEA